MRNMPGVYHGRECVRQETGCPQGFRGKRSLLLFRTPFPPRTPRSAHRPKPAGLVGGLQRPHLANGRLGGRPGCFNSMTTSGRPLTKPTEVSAKFSPFDNPDATVAVRNSHRSPATPHQLRATAPASAPFPSPRWRKDGRRPDEVALSRCRTCSGTNTLMPSLRGRDISFAPASKYRPDAADAHQRHRTTGVPVHRAGQRGVLPTGFKLSAGKPVTATEQSRVARQYRLHIG